MDSFSKINLKLFSLHYYGELYHLHVDFREKKSFLNVAINLFLRKKAQKISLWRAINLIFMSNFLFSLLLLLLRV